MVQLYIDGEYVDGSDGQTFEVVDPRNEEVMAHCAQANAEDVDKAVLSARKAFDKGEWTRMGGAVSPVRRAPPLPVLKPSEMSLPLRVPPAQAFES